MSIAPAVTSCPKGDAPLKKHRPKTEGRMHARSVLLFTLSLSHTSISGSTASSRASPTRKPTVHCRLLAASRVDPTGPIPERAASRNPSHPAWDPRCSGLFVQSSAVCTLKRSVVFADMRMSVGRGWLSGCERRRLREWMSTCRIYLRVPSPCGLHPPVATLTRAVRLDSRPAVVERVC